MLPEPDDHRHDDLTGHPGALGHASGLRLLGVWAHPDDETYLSASLMHRVVRAGGHVTVATATHGEQGADIPDHDRAALARLRHGELRRAMSALGVHDVRFLGHPDGRCADVGDHRGTSSIEFLVRSVRPDLVVTFGPDGITGHPDHVAVARWVTRAWDAVRRSPGSLRRVPDLRYATMTTGFVRRHHRLYPELPLTLGPEPFAVPDDAVTRVRPTRAERRRKRAALWAHASQTVPLMGIVGMDRFFDWWVDETFRPPTEADLETFGISTSSPDRLQASRTGAAHHVHHERSLARSSRTLPSRAPSRRTRTNP